MYNPIEKYNSIVRDEDIKAWQDSITDHSYNIVSHGMVQIVPITLRASLPLHIRSRLKFLIKEMFK